MKPNAILLCLSVPILLLLLVVRAGESPSFEAPASQLTTEDNIEDSVARVNSWLRDHWSREGLKPADVADDLTVLRRLSLALHGTIPSLEEVAAFNADASKDRLERWLLKMLSDDRFPNYFADRLARVLTGVEEGQFVIFRRDRLRAWLSEQLAADRPWDEMTRELIAAEGLWTSHGASNFLTGAFVDGEGLDENVLAGRTVRAFLGQRIDCAQCHDHPFDSWKQADFEGLAAFYGQARVMPGGVIDRETEDGKPVVYEVIDPGEEEGRVVEPSVPFNHEWIEDTGNRRQQLATWVTHENNRRFERAIVNRVWGLMFGRAWFDPVDDLPHPEDAEEDRDLLDVLGTEFRNHGNSLHFLIKLIAQSDVFRLQSEASWADEDTFALMDDEWAVFPLVRLRPEQMIGSMFQASGVKTIDMDSNMFVRFIRFTNENDFLKEYGDATDDELLQQSGTIPQALLRMNGKFTRELTAPSAFNASNQILKYSGEDKMIIQNCFLACLTRFPTAEEEQVFTAMLSGAEDLSEEEEAKLEKAEKPKRFSRGQTVQDIYWMLFNSPRFFLEPLKQYFPSRRVNLLRGIPKSIGTTPCKAEQNSPAVMLLE